jgi:AcrR family transcriptional regulator
MPGTTATDRVGGGRLGPKARKAQLLRLGLELFGSRSYDEVSIEDIAAAARISKGLLYHYFPTKHAFYAEALRVAASELKRRTELDPALPPAQRFAEGLRAYLRYVEEHAVSYVGLFRGGLGVDKELCAIVEATRVAMVNRFLSAIGVKKARPVLLHALRGWLGFVEAASLHWAEHRDLDRESLVALLVSIAGATLAAASRIDGRLRLSIDLGRTGLPPFRRSSQGRGAN